MPQQLEHRRQELFTTLRLLFLGIFRTFSYFRQPLHRFLRG
jgi:hypothetical protein